MIGMGSESDKIFRLNGKVQHYAWGGMIYLPKLLALANSQGRPFAEYWLGAHDNASSELIRDPGGELSAKLNDYIRANPKGLLGDYTAARFGRLPYLLKILDVKDMLSIQVHPSKKDAEQAFLEENKKGIPLNAPDRNYKDDNHKPELMLALSEFWLLHGFKPVPLLAKIIRDIPELNFLEPFFENGGYQELYRAVMEMEPLKVNAVLQPLLDRILPAYGEGQLSKDKEDFWAARAALTFNETGRIDRGIFSIYLFNLVNLHPGEAIFQDAGLPHAYLEGQNVEIMANSDNVLRGGLTPKHIDVPELLKHIRFESTEPRVIYGENGARDKNAPAVSVFYTPAPDFELSRIVLRAGETLPIIACSAEIFFVLEGEVSVGENAGNFFERNKGHAFIAFDGGRIELRAKEDSVLFRAAVPIKG
jgi:mannose-6-phosphate isomerase